MTDYDPHNQHQPEHFDDGRRGDFEHDQQGDFGHGQHVDQGHSEPAPPVKKRGPKPMTDRPTVRVEGQLFAEQYDAASAIVSRLKIENRSTPSAERRRMTINTLIRLGMTIVLEHESALHGRSEDELLTALRASLETKNEGSNE